MNPYDITNPISLYNTADEKTTEHTVKEDAHHEESATTGEIMIAMSVLVIGSLMLIMTWNLIEKIIKKW